MRTVAIRLLSGIYGPTFPDGSIGLALMAKIDPESMKTLASVLAENPSVGGVFAMLIVEPDGTAVTVLAPATLPLQGPQLVAPGARALHTDADPSCRCWACTLLREHE